MTCRSIIGVQLKKDSDSGTARILIDFHPTFPCKSFKAYRFTFFEHEPRPESHEGFSFDAKKSAPLGNPERAKIYFSDDLSGIPIQ